MRLPNGDRIVGNVYIVGGEMAEGYDPPSMSLNPSAHVNPLAVCEFCGRQTADPTALCPNPSCQAATSERDSVLAGLVEKELDD